MSKIGAVSLLGLLVLTLFRFLKPSSPQLLGGNIGQIRLDIENGVPSSMSTPRTCNRDPSRRINCTIVSPMGLGRLGERVAKTPCGRLSEGGVPSNSKPPARSKTQSTIRCEKPSMSVSPASY